LGCPYLAVLTHVVLEDVDAAHLRCLPEPVEDRPDVVLPSGGFAEEPLGGYPDRLQDGIAASPLPVLLKCPLHRRAEEGQSVFG
jgi:hypothetical protein